MSALCNANQISGRILTYKLYMYTANEIMGKFIPQMNSYLIAAFPISEITWNNDHLFSLQNIFQAFKMQRRTDGHTDNRIFHISNSSH